MNDPKASDKAQLDVVLSLRGALDKAIARLREYANEDLLARGNSYGCFTDPSGIVEEWIEEIEEIRDKKLN